MHFLLAVDGSEPSTRAAQWLARNARRIIAVARTGAFPTGDAEVLVLRDASGERRAVTIRE